MNAELAAGMLTLYAPDGKPGVGLDMVLGHPALFLFSPGGKSGVQLEAAQTGPGLLLSGPDGKPGVKLYMSGDGPSLRMQDAEGFGTVVGTVDLVTEKTGEQHKRSAGSVVILGKDGKMIWSAP